MGDSGTLTRKRVKFDKKDKALKTGLHGKEYYRDALEDLEKEAKCAGAREFLTNSTVAVKYYKAAEDQVRHEMAAKMGESFDALAMTAEASKTTYEDQARTIATLAATNAELTATVKNLTDKIVTLSEKLVAATKSSSQRGGAPPGFNGDASDTGSAANLDGVFMLTKKSKYGKEFFAANRSAGTAGSWCAISQSSAPTTPSANLSLRRRPWRRPRRRRANDGAGQQEDPAQQIIL